MSKRLKAAYLGAVLAGAALIGSAAALPAGADDAVSLKSASALAFAPNGVLLVGDTTGGQLFSIETGDTARAAAGAVNIDNLNDKIAALLATTPDQVALQDIAVNPMSGAVYIAVNKGTGAAMVPVILRADRTGALALFDVAAHKSTHVALVDAPATGPNRSSTITDIAFSNGKVLVAGLSNEEFASSMRAFAYPLQASAKAASISMWHDNHGRTETAAPVRTFLTYDLNGQPNVLAAYLCTPLVKIPVSEIADGAQIKATTVTELGNLNRPIDMIAYSKDGKPAILIANSDRGVMKLDASNLASLPAITIRTDGTAGMPITALPDLKYVSQLDKVDNMSAVIVIDSSVRGMTAGRGAPAAAPAEAPVKISQLKTIALP